jgi:hypothetical protein
LRSHQPLSYSTTSQHFTNFEGLLRVHKSPPLVPILRHMNPVHTTPLYFSKMIIFNIILLPASRSHQWPLSFRFFPPNPCMHSISRMRATCPAHFILLAFITLIIYVAKGPSYEAPYYAVFSSLLLFHPCSQTPSI